MGFGTVRGKGKAVKSFFLRPLQNLEVELFSLPIVLLLGEIGCVSSISSVSLVAVLSIVGVFVALVSFFRSWGYGLSVVGAIFFGLALCNNFPVSVFWGGLLTVSFIISYGILLLSVSLVEGHIKEKAVSLSELTASHNSLQDSYNREVQERKEKEFLAQSKITALEQELSVSHEQLQEVSRKYTHASEDLQILIDQRDSWLKDYMTLHQEYVRVVAGDEENVIFPWKVFQGNSEKDSGYQQRVQDAEHKIAHLEKLCEEENSGKRYAEECLDKALADLLESTRLREILEKEIFQKDEEIASLKQEIAAEKLLSSSVSDDRAAYKGKYLQLREQFTVKDSFLKKARRERFLAQEQLLVLKRAKEEEASNLSTTDSFSIIQNLLLQIEALEEEVTYLEELVLHNQNR